jgi:CheY-like chemotaxis protein
MDLNEVTKRFEGFLGRIIGEDIEFKTNMEQEKLLVVADASQIEQVLMNLATNARDAMPEGGSLTIGSGLINIDNDFCKAHGYGEPGPYALITVTDTGVGMDKETLSKIFEPFFTTKEQGKGTGLGLSIVYGIIKQHNGYVNAYSEPGKGTTFRIYIPAMRECVTIGRKEESAVKAIIGGTETVLVAEDDVALRKLSTVVLEGAGYHVISAEDGADAVEKFAEHKEEIQICIIDMIMPRKCGKEVFDEIKKMRHNIKVLFVSGYTGDRIHKEGPVEEGFEFITKPVSPRDLLRKVREMLGSCF